MSTKQPELPLGEFTPHEPVTTQPRRFHRPAEWSSNNAKPEDPQPELPLGEFCPEHPPDSRVLMATPVGYWNTNPNAVYARYRDTVYGCVGRDDGRDDRRACSWAWSQQVGLFVPAGLDYRNVCYPTMYHEKRYRPRKWERECARVLAQGATTWTP